MGGSYAGNAITFLVETLFGIYILVVMLRFLLQWARADFHNPISQFIVKATQPPLRFLRQFVPAMGGLDGSSVVLLLALQCVELWILFGLAGAQPAIAGLLLLAIAKLLELAIYVFFFAILIQVVMSWINPGGHNPALSLVYTLTEPLMRPARRLIPPVSGFDLSPIPVMIGLQLLLMILIAPLRDLAASML